MLGDAKGCDSEHESPGVAGPSEPEACAFLCAPGRPSCFPVGPLERACITVTWEPVVMVCQFLGPYQTWTVKQLWGWGWESAF